MDINTQINDTIRNDKYDLKLFAVRDPNYNIKMIDYNDKKLTEDEIIINESDYDAKHLDLCYNKITDFSKINGFNMLFNVEILALSNNPIQYFPNFNTFKNVKTLYLNQAQLVSTRGIEELVNLEKLDLTENKISELVGFDNLIKLKHIELIANQITDISPLCHLINLEYLDIQLNKITNIDPIVNLINLNNLNLYQNPIEIVKINPQCIPDSLEVLALHTYYQISTFDIPNKDYNVLLTEEGKNKILEINKDKMIYYKDIVHPFDNNLDINKLRLDFLKLQKKLLNYYD